MKVFVTRPTHLSSQPWEEGYCTEFERELRGGGSPHHELVANAADADIIILLESNIHKTASSVRELVREPMLVNYCSKVCCINYEDTPAGFLRGLYTSLEGGRFDSSIHKSWAAIQLPNKQVYDIPERAIFYGHPTYLLSFVGSLSHPLRRRLLEVYGRNHPGCKVVESTSWYNHSRDEWEQYIEYTLQSYFVLCPRGHSCYTHRIAEVMALGRVPVIIADGWIPFSIPENDYYIRVSEAEVDNLYSLLSARRHEAEAIGRRARAVWCKYFAKEVRTSAAVSAAAELVERAARPMELSDYRKTWASFRFRHQNRMLIWQRAWRKCRDLVARANNGA